MDKKEKKEWIELTERDKLMLYYLAKFKAMFASTLLRLTDMADNYGRKRIQKLVRCGYIEISMLYVNKPAMYSVTEKGLRAIGSDFPYYCVKNDNAFHEAVVAETASWLHLHHDIPMDEILSEREMKRQGIHFGGKERTFPDLYIPSYSLCVDYEHNAKTTSKTRGKIFGNASKCEKQFWVVDEDNKALADRIKAIAKEDEHTDAGLATVTREFIEKRLEKGVTDGEKEIIADFLR